MRRFLFAFVFLLCACTASAATPATVVSAVDGDTLMVRIGDREERVRIIGIDTPETVDPRKPVQCFGPEASDEMHSLADGREVTLIRKPDEDRDKYHRLLRYVELDGKDLGAQMIEEGFAVSYKYFPHPRLEQYNALEKEAKSNGLGLWSACKKRKKS